MITSKNLDYYKSQEISDVNIEDLKDITSIRIDTQKPVVERILS